MTTDRGGEVSLWAFPADGSSRWPVYPSSASFGHDGLMTGAMTLTLPAEDELVTRYRGSTLGEEFPQIVMRAFRVGASRPLWVGPVTGSRLASSDGAGAVDLTCMHMWQHLHGRRAAFGSAALAAMDYNEAADNIHLKIAAANMGSSPTVPTGHPGTRQNFGAFTVTVASPHGGGGLAPSRRYIAQSGASMLDVANELVEGADLRPVLGDNMAAGFTIDNDYPFEDTDRSASIVFGQWRGNMGDFELHSDRAALANVWALEGKTAHTPQWSGDATSMSLWGEFEAYAQKPEDAHVSAVIARTADDLRDGYGPARITYKADAIETPGHRFGVDWGWADRIGIEEAHYGFSATPLVRQWNISMTDGVVDRIDVGLGVVKAPDLLRHVVGYTGRPGVAFGGNVFRNRRQN